LFAQSEATILGNYRPLSTRKIPMNPKRHFLISTLIFSILSSFSLVITIPSAHAFTVSCGAGTYTVTSGVASGGNGCTGVVTLDGTITSIDASAFYSTQITQLTIPDSVTSIGQNAFYAADQLTTLTIGNGVITIGQNAFYAADQLTTLTLGNEVTSIGQNAFYAADQLTTLTLGNKVTTIGNAAFYTSPLSPSLTLPASLTSLGVSAFYAAAYELICLTNLSAVVLASPLSNVPSCVDTAPAAPTLNSVTAGDRRVTVSFTAGANYGTAITDYEYSLNGGAYTSAGTTTSPFTITGLSGRTAYSVTIKARNSAGLSTASSSLSATTTDAAQDASEAAAAEAARLAAIEAARLAAAKAAEEDARRAKEQKELTELLSVIPSIAGLALNLGDLTNSLLTTKCVKGKTVKYVKKGAKCPKGYVKKK
jgi:hypothetical protein